jgi:hypothetical protein
MKAVAKPQGCFKAAQMDAKCARSVVCKSAIQRAQLFATTVALTAGETYFEVSFASCVLCFQLLLISDCQMCAYGLRCLLSPS